MPATHAAAKRLAVSGVITIVQKGTALDLQGKLFDEVTVRGIYRIRIREGGVDRSWDEKPGGPSKKARVEKHDGK